jgi:hypothetical protein
MTCYGLLKVVFSLWPDLTVRQDRLGKRYVIAMGVNHPHL